MTLPAPTLDPKFKKLIRQDVQSMHAYAIQDSAGMVKLDAMENPHRLPMALPARGLFSLPSAFRKVSPISQFRAACCPACCSSQSSWPQFS